VTAPRPGLPQRARQGYDRAIDVLELAVPLARGVRTTVVLYAALVAASALAIAVALIAVDRPDATHTWLAALVVVAVLALPAIILFFFASLLGEVLRLPEKLRAVPDVGPAHARDLAALVRESRASGRKIRLRTLPGDLLRLGRLVLRLHDDIPTTGVLLALVRVPMLIAVGVAFVAGLVQILFAPVIVLFALAASAL
jgi:MFS family permease